MRQIWTFIKNQPVRFFALVCVAITTAYVMWMGYRLSNILTSPGWCNGALNADKVTKTVSDFDALQACIGLLGQQLKATALNSHIYAGVIALCLLALMVIVVAGGHLSFTAPGGFSGNMGQEPQSPAKAAAQVAGAAVDEAEHIANKNPAGEEL